LAEHEGSSHEGGDGKEADVGYLFSKLKQLASRPGRIAW